MVCDQHEGLTIEIVLKVLQGPYCCKALFLDSRVADLSGFEFSTGASDGVFLTLTILSHLSQHCSQTDV